MFTNKINGNTAFKGLTEAFYFILLIYLKNSITDYLWKVLAHIKLKIHMITSATNDRIPSQLLYLHSPSNCSVRRMTAEGNVARSGGKLTRRGKLLHKQDSQRNLININQKLWGKTKTILYNYAHNK